VQTLSDTFDLVVIGAGTGGYVAAIRAAQLGLRTAVVERQPVLGGTCLNWGCIPTKNLLEHAHALKVARQAADWGISYGEADVQPAIDMSRVQARQEKVVGGLTRGIEYLFTKNRITWVKGSARLSAPGRVEVAGPEPRSLQSKEIIIATGSAPRRLTGVTIDGLRIITSDDAVRLSRVPRSLIVAGSGAVGVEFASIFRSFGSEVTIVEALPRLVPGEDSGVSAELEKAFRKRGIAIHCQSTIVSAAVDGAEVVVEISDRSHRTEMRRADTLLVAVGRSPVTDGLGLDVLGIETERGYVKVDDHYRANIAGVSAIGDVITIPLRRHPQLAHVASAEGIAVAERLAGRTVEPVRYDQVPSCTYCDPEIGSVGLTETDARELGYDVRVAVFPFSAIGRARIANEVEGFVKVVGESQHDQLLGLHIIGPRATELVAEGTVALRLESTVEDLVRTIHAHPTLSEAVGEAAHMLHGGAIHL
jgi:dihydrolipoamide dehydrogenase